MAPRTDDPVVSRSELLARGMSDHQIRQARERGELHSVLPGIYLRTRSEPPADPAERHRATLTVVVPLLAGRPVVSHLSAAIMHGLPFCHSEFGWLGRPRPGESPPMHVTRPDAAKSRRGAAVQLHTAALGPDEVVELGGLPVTTPERTVVDCALTVPFDHAVMLADAALHRGLASRDSLERQLGRLHRVPGTRRAAEVLAFADPRSRGAGESLSRVLMQRCGLPTPELDVAVTSGDGRPLGRVAFAFRTSRVLGDFLDLGAAADSATERRAAALRDAGWQPVHWSWPELRTPADLLDRLREALAPVRAQP